MSVKKEPKSKKFTNKMKKKLLVIFLLVGIVLLGLSYALIRLNLSKGKSYSKAVYNNYGYDSRAIAARRGDITDRNGTILAYSTRVYNLIIDSKVMLSSDGKYRQSTVDALAEYFPDLDMDKLNEFLDENAQKENKNAYKKFLEELTEDEISEFKTTMSESDNIKGVWFEEEYKRTYPFKSLAADLIGFASNGGSGEIGIEQSYNSYLSGTDGRIYGYINDSSYKSQVISAENGNTIVSTIDYSIQNIIENSIKSFNDEYGSLSTTVVVMNPKNGEVLGMADYPTFDLNNPRDVSSMYTDEELDAMDEDKRVEAYYSLWKNNAVSKIYEPGSVFKTFTVSELIEENLIKLTDIVKCDGHGVYDSTKILCNGGEGHGDVTPTWALCRSCNDALMQYGEMLGKDTFNRYLHIYKFGQKTDIDIPSEEAGLLISESGMMDVDLATNSFGQNLSVNMIQMMAAFSSVINGGKYYKPHVVKEIRDSQGELVETINPVLVTETVSEETSAVMRSMLRAVVDYGTAGYVYMDGYSIGGKTGAAEKIPRDKKSYVVSFMGFAPAEDPEVLVYVVIDTPDCEEYDTSWSAQMVAADIMHKLVPYLGIPADNPDYDRDVYIDAKTLKPVVKRPSSVDVDEVKPDGGANLPDEEESASKEDGQEKESSENEKPDENESPPEESTPDGENESPPEESTPG